jgi:malonyl-CoA decarboxylase
MMTILGDILSTLFERRATPHDYSEKNDGPVTELCHTLMSPQGEVIGIPIAGKVLAAYDQMDDAQKVGFFTFLLTEMDVDISAIQETLKTYEDTRNTQNLTKYLALSETKRRELFRRLNQGVGSTKRLVAMRMDLMRLAKTEPKLKSVDLDFQQLFRSWFNNGFLVLRPISWASPAEILEKIIAYEAVHAIDSWDELRRRLEPTDRRCFAYFHPAMPDEPLIFVEVALTKTVPDSIQGVLAETRDVILAEQANTAVFYSISNCQQGLAGISFGNALIKNVAGQLAHEIPNLTTFVTLSPIPKLASWRAEQGHLPENMSDDELRKLAAQYLLEAKRPDNMPIDPVARFHLNNGAFVHAIHAEADTSASGQKQSFGAMVNYMYDLSAVSENHELFAMQGQVVSSKAVKALAKSKPKKSKAR